MKKIIFASYLYLATFMIGGLFVNCSSGGGDDVNDTTPSTPENLPQIIDIKNSDIDISGNEPMFYLYVAEQQGGMAKLTATETRAGENVIPGVYNTQKGCYEFDLSDLEDKKTYNIKIMVYNNENKVVIESTVKTITMPDTSDSAIINPEGESDGTRSF